MYQKERALYLMAPLPSQLLWVSSVPGKGKTMLSIFLAEELEREVIQPQDTAFVQYFCHRKDENRNTAVAIMRGLIFRHQLLVHIYLVSKIERRLS